MKVIKTAKTVKKVREIYEAAMKAFETEKSFETEIDCFHCVLRNTSGGHFVDIADTWSSWGGFYRVIRNDYDYSLEFCYATPSENWKFGQP